MPTTATTASPYTPYAFEYDVQIFDTDCYGVVWHGAYAKWLEMGRVDMLKTLGVDLKVMGDAHNMVFPVIEQTVRYRASGRFGDRVRLSTNFTLDGYKFLFEQHVHALPNSEQGGDRDKELLLIDARTTTVVISNEGKLQRRLPTVLSDLLATP